MSKYSNIDYGPLEQFSGTWEGNKGTDIAPAPDGEKTNPYFETITYENIGSVSNAEEQKLVAIHYRQIVRLKTNEEVFHDQTGYWIWDSAHKTIMHSFVIPRAVSVISGGIYTGETDSSGRVVLDLGAKLGDADWGITQSPFMANKASSIEFRQKVAVGNGTMSYSQTTLIDIYGRVFEHTDDNELSSI